MGKIIFLAIIAVIGWVLFKGLGKGKSGSKSVETEKPATGKTTISEQMVKCHRCSVMMPES